MNQISKRLISILGSLALVAVALFVFFGLIQPEYANVAQIRGQLAGENQILENETQAVASVQKIVSEYQQEPQSVQTLNLALPQNQDIADALAQIYGIAQTSGIAITTVAVSSPVLQIATTTIGAVTNPLGSFSLQISAAGSYEGLKRFLAGLETNVRIFDLKSITIAPAGIAGVSGTGKGASPANQDFFTYTLSVATYYQATQAPQIN